VRRFAVVVHGVELSIGSAHGLNDAYLKNARLLQKEWPFLWHSEHLGFQTIPGDKRLAHSRSVVPLPMPATVEAVDLVASRSATILKALRAFHSLLENPGALFFRASPDPEIGNEYNFLTCVHPIRAVVIFCSICTTSTANAVNHHFDARM
jgi:uncharacterized protein (UPF0276 family)